MSSEMQGIDIGKWRVRQVRYPILDLETAPVGFSSERDSNTQYLPTRDIIKIEAIWADLDWPSPYEVRDIINSVYRRWGRKPDVVIGGFYKLNGGTFSGVEIR